MRPDLRIEQAFLDLSKPSFDDGRGQARPRRPRRDRGRPAAAHRGLPRQGRRARARVAEAAARHEGLKIRATAILGLEACFLEVLDVRMREALKAARVRELDALVLAAAGSSDPLANQAVARLARVWGQRHKLPVTAAFASAAPPATGEAVRQFRAEGRRHIAVASLFLAPGLPARTGPRSWPSRPAPSRSSAPLGAHPRPGPHHPGPVRRRRGGARPRLSRVGADGAPNPPSRRRCGPRTWPICADSAAISGHHLRPTRLVDQGVQQVVELGGRVGGHAAVHRAGLEDGAARRLEEAEARGRAARAPAAPPRSVAGADAVDEVQRVAHRVEVDAGVRARRSRSRSTCHAAARKSAAWQ